MMTARSLGLMETRHVEKELQSPLIKKLDETKSLELSKFDEDDYVPYNKYAHMNSTEHLTTLLAESHSLKS